MSLPELILLCVVVFIGVPAAVRWPPGVRNLTALALVCSWAFGWLLYLGTGVGVDVRVQIFADMAVITAIYCKQDDCGDFRGPWHQLCRLWTGRTYADRVVLSCFPAMWALYAFANPYQLYWGLWWLAIAQFVAAGCESVFDGRAATRPFHRQDESPPASGLMFVPARVGVWDG